MKHPIRGLTLALCAVALVAGTADVSAQAWPQKPIRIINPFPPGGGTDVFARPLAAKLSVALGQQVLIENMAGAGGTVGAARAAKEIPDGYTWYMGAVHHTIAETLYTKLLTTLQDQDTQIVKLTEERDELTKKRDEARKQLEEYLNNLTIG